MSDWYDNQWKTGQNAITSAASYSYISKRQRCDGYQDFSADCYTNDQQYWSNNPAVNGYSEFQNSPSGYNSYQNSHRKSQYNRSIVHSSDYANSKRNDLLRLPRKHGRRIEEVKSKNRSNKRFADRQNDLSSSRRHSHNQPRNRKTVSRGRCENSNYKRMRNGPSSNSRSHFKKEYKRNRYKEFNDGGHKYSRSFKQVKNKQYFVENDHFFDESAVLLRDNQHLADGGDYSGEKSRQIHQENVNKVEESFEGLLLLERDAAILQVDRQETLTRVIHSIMAAINEASISLSQQAKSEVDIQALQFGSAGVQNANSLPPRVILGVIRVGPAQKKLLVKGSTSHGEELVVVFQERPTKQLLSRLATLIEFNLKGADRDNVLILPHANEEQIIVDLEKYKCSYSIYISFTYAEPLVKTSDYSQHLDSCDEYLSEEKCKMARTKIRRMRWHKKVRKDLELPVTRLLMDLGSRLPGWKHLTLYSAEVLVNAVMSKLAKDVRDSELTVSRLFTQCLEVLAGGLLLEDSLGLKDPCEPGCINAFGYLTIQEVEELTVASQLAVRMFACGRLAEMLGIDTEPALS